MERDLRKYTCQTQTRLFVGFLLILLIIGEGLIWVFWGRDAALMGLLCLMGALSPLLLIALALWGIDWFVKRFED